MTREHLCVGGKDGRRNSSTRNTWRSLHGQQCLLLISLPPALPQGSPCSSRGGTFHPPLVTFSNNCAGEEVSEQGEHREQPEDTDELESQDMASHGGDLLWSREGTVGAEATEMLLR